MEVEKPHYIGHQQRLKKKLLNSSAENFADYELLEILLFFAIPRKDVKPLAKKILEKFGSISNLINTEKEKLLLLEGINENFCVNIYLIKELITRILKQKISNRNIISSWEALLDYLKSSMGGLKLEQFRTLFLNKKYFNCR